jgi:biopolymer transport protein ExbD
MMNSGKPTMRSIQARPLINVTPLIDVLLVLLIIFMVIAPMAPRLYAARLPERPPIDDRQIVEDLSLVVSLKADGTYDLNMLHFATLSEVEARLKEALDGRPADRCAVFVRAPRGMRYGEIIKAVDAAKAAGGRPIGMVIDQLDQ